MTTKRFRDVWDAIEDTPAAAENLKIRSVLMDELIPHKAQEGKTQLEVSEIGRYAAKGLGSG